MRLVLDVPAMLLAGTDPTDDVSRWSLGDEVAARAEREYHLWSLVGRKRAAPMAEVSNHH